MKSLFLAIAIIAHEPGYYTSLANHIHRWLGNESIASKVIKPTEMATALKREQFAFLVGFSSPTTAEMTALREFRSRGGKLCVFYSASPALAELMGVRPMGYRSAAYPGEFSRMDFSVKNPEGLPASILQTSTVLQRARPIEGKGNVMAYWMNREGKSTGEPAWIATTSGYWMTHVLLADGEEDKKAQLLGALIGAVNPKTWNLAEHKIRKSKKAAAIYEYAKQQTPIKGEIHAVWDHSGCGLYPGDWPRTIRVLKAAHVTDLFVNVAGAGFAHYASNILPRSKTFVQEGDQLAACLDAAKNSGIRVHAWILCFSATRATNAWLEEFKRRGWRLTAANGTLSEYLNPSNSEVRAYILSAIEELQTKYKLSGVHLDFVRWGDNVVKPKDSAGVISQFVAEARRRVKRPKWLTTAVYGKYPQCINSVGQDWPSWIDMGIVDYVVPMNYCESNAQFEGLLIGQATRRLRKQKTIIGIGVTANESRLDAKQVIDQIRLSRKYGFAGEAMFDLDKTLENSILPYLKLGIW